VSRWQPSSAPSSAERSAFVGNSAGADGGGLFLDRESPTMVLAALSFTSNRAGGSGGAIFAAHTRQLAMRDPPGRFVGNEAPINPDVHYSAPVSAAPGGKRVKVERRSPGGIVGLAVGGCLLAMALLAWTLLVWLPSTGADSPGRWGARGGKGRGGGTVRRVPL
jgi:predicted outer membrane repeat protein